MTIRVLICDRDLAASCARRSHLAARWGEAADSVRLALSVLAASSGLDEFEDLSTVRREGDLTVFAGQSHDVMLSLSCSTGSDDIFIHALDVRRAEVRT